MNYFLRVDGLADFSLKLSENNKTDLHSNLALGVFIANEDMPDVVHYIDTPDSDAYFSDINESDFILNVSGGCLVSVKVKEIIENYFPNECQFIKAKIEHKGILIENFYSINIFNKINCYDLSLSEYELINGLDTYDFEKIVLIDQPLEEYGAVYNIVRSEEDNKIVVSEKFKKKMEAHYINNVFFEREFDMFS